MGRYMNFVQDFPSRCNTLLNEFNTLAEYMDREVTLMLCVATSGLIVPYERLKPGPVHPSNDRHVFAEAAQRLEDLENTPFLGSRLWDTDPRSWRRSKEAQEIRDAGISVWGLDSVAEPLSPRESAKAVVGALRNALAHGNIFSRGNPIDTLIFLSKPDPRSNEFNFYMVSPSDFRHFMCNWFKFIETMDIPDEMPIGVTS